MYRNCLYWFKKNKCVFNLLLLVAFFLNINLVPVVAADNFSDMIAYRGGGNIAIPEYTKRQNGSFGVEATAMNVGGTILDVKIQAKPDPLSNEKVLCTRDAGSDVNCQVWNGSSWASLVEMTANDGGSLGFDLAYEAQAKRAMVCYRGTVTNTPSCRIWNGSAWGSVFNGNSVGSPITTMRLVSDPASNFIALITKDNSNDINIQFWNGTAFTSVLEIETDGGSCARCVSYDGAWERSGYSDGSFRTDVEISRGEAAKMVVLAMQAKGVKLPAEFEKEFPDVSQNDEFYRYITFLYNKSIGEETIVSGFADGTFKTGNRITRGEISKIIWNSMKGSNLVE